MGSRECVNRLARSLWGEVVQKQSETCATFQCRGDPCQGGFDVGARIERADTHVAFAALAEAGARGAYHLGVVQQQVEKLP